MVSFAESLAVRGWLVRREKAEEWVCRSSLDNPTFIIAIAAMEEDEKLVLELMTIHQKHVSNFPVCGLMPIPGILSLIILVDEPMDMIILHQMRVYTE